MYSEATIDAAIKPERSGKRLMSIPSRDDFEDLEMYFKETEKYNQASLACLLKIRTSQRLLKAQSGTEDFCDKQVDAVRPPTTVKLQLETDVHNIVKLNDATICPKVGGQGGNTITGTLEAHVNGFLHKTSGAHPNIAVLYENIKCAFYRDGYHKTPPLLHFHLRSQILLGTEETSDIKFHLVGQTDDRNKDLEDFVDKVDNLWDSKPVPINPFESSDYEFHGVLPTKGTADFSLTLFFLVELGATTPIVVSLSDIEIVNLAQLRLNEIDMTVVFKDFTRDVLQINSIPIESLAGIKHRLNFAGVKYYENEQELDWNDEVKKIRDNPLKFIEDGGWESLNLEADCYCYDWEEDSDLELEKELW